jgi:hypothetical protein
LPVNLASDEIGGFDDFCLKYQHHATADLLPPNPDPLSPGFNPLLPISSLVGNCASLQAAPLTDMFTAAKQSGQMTQDEHDLIIFECFQGKKALFHVEEDVSKHQPCGVGAPGYTEFGDGEYLVEAVVVNAKGQTFQAWNFFDVFCTPILATDFDNVVFPPTPGGGTGNVQGDEIFSPGDGKPTAKNIGNSSLYLEIHYDPLVSDTVPVKTIIDFDLKMKTEWQPIASITNVPDIQASHWYCFVNQFIGANQVAKIDFSVHPPLGTIAANYTGMVNMLQRPDCVGHVGDHAHP